MNAMWVAIEISVRRLFFIFVVSGIGPRGSYFRFSSSGFLFYAKKAVELGERRAGE